MNLRRLEINYEVEPWLHDHALGGRAVLPAVHSLELLARTVRREIPACRVQTMADGRFPRFLELPPDSSRLQLIVELAKLDADRVRGSLCSRKQLGRMSRLVEHARVIFGGPAGEPPRRPTPEGARLFLDAAEVYREKVPFGPGFQSLTGPVNLGRDQVWGRVQALVHGQAGLLGSPFPLDGAMHAACVLGQELVDYIPFPVGFTRRKLLRPTAPGRAYDFIAWLTGRDGDGLIFDLLLLDGEQVMENVTGLVMRKVG